MGSEAKRNNDKLMSVVSPKCSRDSMKTVHELVTSSVWLQGLVKR